LTEENKSYSYHLVYLISIPHYIYITTDTYLTKLSS